MAYVAELSGGHTRFFTDLNVFFAQHENRQDVLAIINLDSGRFISEDDLADSGLLSLSGSSRTARDRLEKHFARGGGRKAVTPVAARGGNYCRVCKGPHRKHKRRGVAS